MASEKLFAAVPAFPEDVFTARMYTISLESLTSGDISAARSVLQACQDLGFFLLDLRGDAIGEAVIKDVDSLFRAGEDIMNLPDEIKDDYRFDPPKSFLGFKASGIAKTETNESDRYEWLNVGQDSLMNNAPLQSLPDLVHEHLPAFRSHLKHCQYISHTINTVLATQLGLPSDTFTSLQPPEKLSGTQVRFIKSYASLEEGDLRTSMIHHTDFGTVTLLANVLGGLQILAPGKAETDNEAWLYVRPEPGCLIVNLGDAMVQWTGGLLRSNCHRISYAPGAQRLVDRYSLAVLFRPERNASMRRLIGEGEDGEDGNLTAWEWDVKKTLAMRRELAVTGSTGAKKSSIL